MRDGGIDNAVQEAEWLVRYNNGDDIKTLVKRRINGEPLQYLLKEWEFYGYPVKVGKGVLIPRPETELAVDLAKEFIRKQSGVNTVLDLCSGTGCVGIALAKQTECNVIAVEKSAEAFFYLEQNIRLNNLQSRVKPILGDVLSRDVLSLAEAGAVIVINPPYLSEYDMAHLQKEVTHEPRDALYGGEDGLDFYRDFFALWQSVLRDCAFFCEVGDGQAVAVAGLMREVGLTALVERDFNGIERFVFSLLLNEN